MSAISHEVTSLRGITGSSIEILRTIKKVNGCVTQRNFTILRTYLKAVCHAFDWVIMTIQRIGNLNG